ncbi:hypothetical protein KU73_09770 [Pectobacterium wasabiae]|uniref:Conjugal transfer protein TraD n=2 Tax=Pectobacterium wasabiae TaxID=55208 RepID=A0AAW3ENM4_9GAMM|nr:hypothetical protein A7983_13540 [Pectobacterium wasabiae CFBP 3304]KFX09254.1 hypothetical protein JV38_06050 [Pectobacterium wasabiae]KGA29361.1 hypothetical protein KU73_09770 [Pectobacterium wasabiae]
MIIMAKLSLQQKKERLKIELAKIESEQKKIEKEKKLKDMRLITAEILKYDIPGIDNLHKVISLLSIFNYKNDKFRSDILKWGDKEISERKVKKIAKVNAREKND